MYTFLIRVNDMQYEWHTSIETISREAWNALTDGSPICEYDFFLALEKSHSIGKDTGWQPLYLSISKDNSVVGITPTFLKYHSYGEYVFDWRWASAFESAGISYYPKLLGAIPFTPIPGTRLFSHDPLIKRAMCEVIASTLKSHQLSSAHLLFVDEHEVELLSSTGWITRTGVQFRWKNNDYKTFEDFLSTLSHDKRKKIRQERRKVLENGIQCQCLTGRQIQAADWDFFYQCYCNTYEQHQSTPYLTRDFFHRIAHSLKENVLMVIAYQEGNRIAASFLLFGEDKLRGRTLYGRYWGASVYIPNLHFEVCYYQAQDFCIREGIQWFEGGAQGEHKLARGFSPTTTYSLHWVDDPQFSQIIANAMQHEHMLIESHQSELEDRSPYRNNSTIR